MNNDDIKRIEEYIKYRRAFRIGGHGICIECYPEYTFYWYVHVPRSFFDAHVDCIDVKDRMLILSVEAGYVDAGQFDLSKYTKVTRLIHDI